MMREGRRKDGRQHKRQGEVYRNDKGTFADVAAAAGVADSRPTRAAAFEQNAPTFAIEIQ